MSSPSIEPGPAAGGALREAKRAMRDRILRARDSLPAEARAHASAAIVTALAAREDFRAARAVLLSLSFRSEWETRPLLEAALALGKIVGAPRVDPIKRMLETYAISDPGRDLESGFLGIHEPLPHCPPLALDAIDWVLVPGVAFDTHGHRIGYGGGYYDRLLPLLRSDARRIAGAFELQVVEQVPAAVHDLRVDAVVTERRTMEAPPDR
jgi:5-formyltetrahydrofolate cyclo-ligase